MARWFTNNVSLMILAVILAFFVWAGASLQEDPILESTVSASVLVTGPPQPDQTISASTLPDAVTVRIRAPQSVLASLGNNGVQVPVNLSQLGAGEHVIQLEPTVNASQFVLLSSRPTTASVTIEQVAQASFPIRVSVEGTPAIGYQPETSSIAPEQAVVSGTQGVVSQVATIDAVVNVDGVRSSVEQTVRLVARDQNGITVDDVNISPNVAFVRVPMVQRSGFKDLAVRVQPTGRPADGYSITGISAAPQVVTVFGPRDAIQQLPGYIDTLEVPIANATEDVEMRIGLNVPPNVSPIADNTTVLVRVNIEPQQGARTISRKPSVLGVTDALTATVSPLTVDIVLAGPLPTLNKLTADDVRVEVDGAGLGVGVNQITPNVIVPDGITVQSVLPSTVQIEITDTTQPPPP